MYLLPSFIKDMPSMLEYVDYMKNQTKWMEAELAECDTLLEESNLSMWIILVLFRY